MRDPALGKPRRKQARDLDVPTLVETVTACASSHISREDTPLHTPRESKDITPHRQKDTVKPKECSRKAFNPTPRKKASKSPKIVNKTNSPAKNAKDDPIDLKYKENVSDSGKTRTHEIKVELKPKSPEKLMELNAKALKPESNLDSKRTRESPNLNYENDIEIQTEFAENLSKMDRELSPRNKQDGCADGRKSDRDRNKVAGAGPGNCEVSRLLRQLCGGDASGNRNERISGAKNAQLVCVSGTSPRQPTTPQLLRILEETIQKKTPKPLYPRRNTGQECEKLRLPLTIEEQVAERQLQYRGRFVQHMLTSCMYANSAVGKPWQVIGSVSDQIIDELLLGCAKEMELRDIVEQLYMCETR